MLKIIAGVVALLALSIVHLKGNNIQEAEVIYLPEIHTSREDHEFQLKVIQDLYQKNKDFVIAMEMFQQNVQEALDEYVMGKITEEEMLEKTQYRERWGYDASLYAPIWRFVREKGIRIYAINLPTEVMQKIREQGIENVYHPSLPNPIMDHTEKERERLKSFLQSHPTLSEKNLLDGQNAWDNAMALAIYKLLQKHKKIVVIIGKGHAPSLEEGVPRRVKQLRTATKQIILTRDPQTQD